MNFRDAVERVRDNGGVPVVAHPGLNLRGRERIVEKLLERGAEGLEVFNNYHDDRQIAYFAPLVRRRGALMTCGNIYPAGCSDSYCPCCLTDGRRFVAFED